MCLTDITTRAAVAAQGNNPARMAINAPTNATFQIIDTKLHILVVTLSTEDDNVLQQLKSGFKRTINWNKYSAEMTNQTKTNNLNYLIDPIFNKFNRLFVLLFENEEDRTSFSMYYTPEVEINCFDVPVKKTKKHMKKLLRSVKIMITQLVIY